MRIGLARLPFVGQLETFRTGVAYKKGGSSVSMAATADLELSATAALASRRGSAADNARRLLWLSFAFFVAGVGIGVGWDRRWHATHPFEDFFSPPHLFIYTNVLLAAAVAVYVTFNALLRAAFGRGETLPLFRFRVPGPFDVARRRLRHDRARRAVRRRLAHTRSGSTRRVGPCRTPCSVTASCW